MSQSSRPRPAAGGTRRRGAFAVLALICLLMVMAFAALSVDYSVLAMSRQRMQNACDAAALAAAMEITAAIESAGPEVSDTAAYAKMKARQKAAEVAALNGVYIDPQRDVEFGRRYYDQSTGTFGISWSGTTSNLVRVTARRDNPDRSQPDAMPRVTFASAIGRGDHPIVTTASAYIEARDIVCVLDFSRSMNFDSYFASEAPSTLSQSQIEANLLKVWQDLGSPVYGNMPYYPTWVTIPSATWGAATLKVRWQDTSVYIECASNMTQVRLTFSNGSTQSITPSGQTGTFAGTGSNAGRSIHMCEVRRGSSSWETFNFYDNNTIMRGLGLTGVPYPYPSGSWANYFAMVRNTASNQSYYDPKIGEHGFRKKFGTMTLLHYILRFEPGDTKTPPLWQTRHYPFHSMKQGQTLLCDFLEELSFNDYVGMVSYDSSHRVEQTLSGAGRPTVNISAKPICNNYQAFRDMIKYKQAGHYSYATNMCGGLKRGKQLLQQHGRAEARPTLLLMTDGQPNTLDAGESTSLPAGWDWDKLFDYDNDGVADYSTSNSHKRAVLRVAKECVDAGFTIHTMVVGDDGDRDLCRAIAHLGRGIYINVPSDSDVESMQEDVKEAFNRIASFVPPATLLNPEDL